MISDYNSASRMYSLVIQSLHLCTLAIMLDWLLQLLFISRSKIKDAHDMSSAVR